MHTPLHKSLNIRQGVCIVSFVSRLFLSERLLEVLAIGGFEVPDESVLVAFDAPFYVKTVV